MRVKKCCYVCNHFEINIHQGGMTTECEHEDIRFAYEFECCCDKFELMYELSCPEVRDEGR